MINVASSFARAGAMEAGSGRVEKDQCYTAAQAGGCAAAALILASAWALAGWPDAVEIALFANLVLMIMVAAAIDRSLTRAWLPVFGLLGSVGAVGFVMALLPLDAGTGVDLIRLIFHCVHSVSQLGAMAMAAVVWSAADSDKRPARWTVLALIGVAWLQLAGLACLLLASADDAAWTVMADLGFSAWLLAASLGLPKGKRRTAKAITLPWRGEPLPFDPIDQLLEIERYADLLR